MTKSNLQATTTHQKIQYVMRSRMCGRERKIQVHHAIHIVVKFCTSRLASAKT